MKKQINMIKLILQAKKEILKSKNSYECAQRIANGRVNSGLTKANSLVLLGKKIKDHEKLKEFSSSALICLFPE